MNIRKLLVALVVAAIAAPAMASATTFSSGPKNEQVVEGHTVFALIEKVNQGWAIAGLVREITPKVLWFNDQYLVGDEDRYPCGGFVFAVPEGSQSPMSRGINTFEPLTTEEYEYLESYRITDPNDFTWEIDLYSFSYDHQTDPNSPLDLFNSANNLVWVVSVLNTNIPDDGTSSCQPIVDAPTAGYLDPGLNAMCYSGGQYYDDGAQRCGPNTPDCAGIRQAYPDTQDFDGDGVSGPAGGPVVQTTPNALGPVCDWPRLYNFLLFGYWNDLSGRSSRGTDVRDGDNKEYGCSDANGDGVTDCTVGSPDFGADNEDKNGCEEGPYAPDTIQYDCVDDADSVDDDDNEGNSHAYNPTMCDNNGDGVIDLADTDFDGFPDDTPCWGELHTHETARVDLYFSSTFRPDPPISPNYVINDLVGSAAPFHAHNGATGTPTCPPGWINPGGGGYPGAPTPYCP